jgi:hypothetical protein
LNPHPGVFLRRLLVLALFDFLPQTRYLTGNLFLCARSVRIQTRVAPAALSRHRYGCPLRRGTFQALVRARVRHPPVGAVRAGRPPVRRLHRPGRPVGARRVEAPRWDPRRRFGAPRCRYPALGLLLGERALTLQLGLGGRPGGAGFRRTGLGPVSARGSTLRRGRLGRWGRFGRLFHGLYRRRHVPD